MVDTVDLYGRRCLF